MPALKRAMAGLLAAATAAALLALVPRTARAGGIEVPARGAVALGRGGAFMARANEPLALWYNPALLADLEGFQLQLDVSAKNRRACFERSGTHAGFAPGDGRIDRAGLSGEFDLDRRSRFGVLRDYRDEGFPKVCKQNQLGINPYLVGSFRLTDELGLGFGLVSPMGSGGERWGRPDGTVMNDDGELRPSPARYMRLDADTSLVRVGIGLGWAPTDWLRLGGSFFNAFFWGSTTSYTAVLGGERPSLDVEAELGELGDNFIPGGTVSAHFIPHDRLDIGVSFFATDEVDADGSVEATVANYGFTRDNLDTRGASAATITTEQKFPVNLRVPQPWSVNLGLRYAHPRAPGARDRGDRDPMRDEVFDIELDVGL
ncbi:MAG: OmpP1/FadL family transporter, partial [Polyangiales bacterium]